MLGRLTQDLANQHLAELRHESTQHRLARGTRLVQPGGTRSVVTSIRTRVGGMRRRQRPAGGRTRQVTS